MDAPPTAPRWSAKRSLLAALGVVSVGVGALGVVLPGLPTTIFLILASWCFTRSFPALERRLLRNRFFAPYMRFVDRRAPLPPRGKAAIVAVLWTFVLISAWSLWSGSAVPRWVPGLVLAAGCIGTVAVLRWNPGRKAVGTAPPADPQPAPEESRPPEHP